MAALGLGFCILHLFSCRYKNASYGCLTLSYSVVQELPPVEAAALAAATEQVSALCTAAGDFGIPEPPGGWRALEARVHAIALGQAPAPSTETGSDSRAGAGNATVAQNRRAVHFKRQAPAWSGALSHGLYAPKAI